MTSAGDKFFIQIKIFKFTSELSYWILNQLRKENLNISYSIYDIVMFALNHLYITKDGNNVIVTFDQNVTLYNSYTKVIDILNLLE